MTHVASQAPLKDLFSLYNSELHLIDCSDGLTHTYGLSAVADHQIWQIYPELLAEEHLQAVNSVNSGGKPRNIVLPAMNGTQRILSLFHSAGGLGVLEARNVSKGPDPQDGQSTLLYQATHDALTGLPNRRQFSEDLQFALQMIPSVGGIALMQLDLDDFKPVNDTLGHSAGDTVLRLAAERIRSELGAGEAVYRLAGDEFAVILAHGNQPEGAERLGALLVASFKRPFSVDGIALFVGTSVGIAVAPNDGTTSEQLMKAADVALYAAKKEGRGRSATFDSMMLEILEQRELLRRSLRMALEQKQFFLEYQPLTEHGTIVGFEALLRWRHPILGVIPPDAFIPMAERDGLMAEVGLWVLGEACREALKWPMSYTVAVNVSSAEFLTSSLTDRISELLDLIGMPAERLELEITETVLLDRTIDNLDTLNTLNLMGIKISLDDFGTEYSSLSYLKNFPFDSIKIDKYFIADLHEDSKSQSIVKFIIGLAHGLGMQVTAEGVETVLQANWLEREGCDRMQGYLFSRPVGAAKLPDLIAASELSKV
jgi:diguanylate cyclase (GGDEF)-like protein